mgnify:CR=1 FL=1
MSDIKYWVWYSLIAGVATRNDDILTAFPDPEKLYKAGENEIVSSGGVSAARLKRILSTPIEKAEEIVETCKRNGWHIITPESADYPDDLRRLIDMPIVLYVDGDLSCVNKGIAIGVVGTRKPGSESIAIATKISAQAAAAGAVIVSGGALGIDSAAHEGALLAKGKTVCVLGCGLGTDYLRENEPLRREISKSGAVVTEYAPMARASIYSFPARNRIISGMSKGVLVVEAGEKSGSLITARRAAEQGKEVYAIPGSVLSTAYTGANKLITDGARAVADAEDILKPYSVMYPDIINLKKIEEISEKFRLPEAAEPKEVKKSGPPKEKKELAGDYGKNIETVYALFGSEPLHPDEISLISGMPLSEVISALFKLELEGYIKQTDGKNYVLK